jgi:hypothetical protein
VKAHACATLKETHNFEEIGRARVAGRTEHAHEAFRRDVRGLGESGEANGCVDVVAQNCLRESDLTGQHGFEALKSRVRGAAASLIFSVCSPPDWRWQR